MAFDFDLSEDGESDLPTIISRSKKVRTVVLTQYCFFTYDLYVVKEHYAFKMKRRMFFRKLCFFIQYLYIVKS